jgi:CHAT domain-containing protein
VAYGWRRSPLTWTESSRKTDDHKESPFTVATLIPARLPHAQLAFLSACQTARNEDLNLLDEAIHLTSAFQLAGFPHVIGTLWPILDSVSVDVAVGFYTRLSSVPDVLTVADSAQALHDTIRELRDRPGYAAFPSRWAAYIHAGA